MLSGIAFLAGVITASRRACCRCSRSSWRASAASESRWRPFAIVAGLVVSFTTFTLAGAALLSALGLPQDTLRKLAIAMLFVLSASLLSTAGGAGARAAVLLPHAAAGRARLERVRRRSERGSRDGPVRRPGARSGRRARGDGERRLLEGGRGHARVLGRARAAAPRVRHRSQRLAAGTQLVRTHAQGLRQGAGVVIAATAVAIVLSATRTTHDGGSRLHAVAAAAHRGKRPDLARPRATDGREGRVERVSAVPRAGVHGNHVWLNTPNGRPLTLAGLRGRVVLVDFWTYSCINCLRTLPHLEAWDEAYRKDGLTIIGVHSPEFAFEHVPDNVRSAVRRLGVRYPSRSTTTSPRGRRTPTSTGRRSTSSTARADIRHHHFGEGDYAETEARIRALLGETVRRPPTSVHDQVPNRDPDAGVLSRLRAARAARQPGRRAGRRPRILVPAGHPAGGQPRVRRALDGREANVSWPAPAHAFGWDSERTTSSSCWRAGAAST